MSEITNSTYAHMFPSPLLAHARDDSTPLNELLREHILSHERAAPGEQRTNVGGWHSAVGQLEFCGAARSKLLAMAADGG